MLTFLFFQTGAYIQTSENELVVESNIQDTFSFERIEKCKLLYGHHINDVENLNSLYSHLDKTIKADLSLKEKNQIINNLTSQIKKLSEQIQLAAGPDWNKEVLPMLITWHPRREDFFKDDLELQNLRRRFLEGFQNDQFFLSLDSVDLQHLLDLSNTEGSFRDVKIESARFLEKENSNIKKYFYVNNCKNLNCELEISYQKMVTWLEYCQFLRTLKFDLTVNYKAPARNNFIIDQNNQEQIYKKNIHLFVNLPAYKP